MQQDREEFVGGNCCEKEHARQADRHSSLSEQEVRERMSVDGHLDGFYAMESKRNREQRELIKKLK